MARYGARLPLIAGPLITATGFFLFALPSLDGSYWLTFFPGFVVLGIGMAVSIAPLTTVVMNSVDLDRAGAASGINNAVARVAGVLAVAVLGIVMVEAFGLRLNESLAALHLSSNVFRDVQSNLVKLGGLDVPSSVDEQTGAMIHAAIVQAFVFGFRFVMVLCAGLAVASAAVAARMIPSTRGLLPAAFGKGAPPSGSVR